MIRSILLCLFLVGCSQGDVDMDTTEFRSEWNNLNGKVVYFGHQSVGSNIMDGVRYTHTDESIHEFYVGTNRDPESKIDDFKREIMMAKEEGKQIDIALMKFCYVDITSATDVDEVLARYLVTMMELQMEYPDVRFVHTTVPLTTEYLPTISKRNMKRLIKGLIGKPTYDKVANSKREEFNVKLRESVNEHFLFDLAKLESGGHYQEYGVPALLPDYTEDGGHLNQLGRANVAKEFLSFLSK